MHKAQVRESQEKLQQALMKWKTFRGMGSLPFFFGVKRVLEKTDSHAPPICGAL
jgi:hypothetical protein